MKTCILTLITAYMVSSCMTETDTVKGKTLFESSDCVTCHSINDKIIGPSLKDIAHKYTDKDIDNLTNKVIKGGKGNWGEVMMQAHDKLPKEDAKLMVKYILSNK